MASVIAIVHGAVGIIETPHIIRLDSGDEKARLGTM